LIAENTSHDPQPQTDRLAHNRLSVPNLVAGLVAYGRKQVSAGIGHRHFFEKI
jgi:hypothetical protein